MKHKPLLIALLSVAAAAVGCDKPAATTPGEKLDKKIDNIGERAAETAQDLQDYTFAQKAEFTQALEDQLAEMNRDLDALAAQIEKSGDAAKAEAEPRLQALREKAARLDTQLGEVKDATESTWDNVKSNSKKAFSEVKEGFNQARQWLSEKIAP